MCRGTARQSAALPASWGVLGSIPGLGQPRKHESSIWIRVVLMCLWYEKKHDYSSFYREEENSTSWISSNLSWKTKSSISSGSVWERKSGSETKQSSQSKIFLKIWSLSWKQTELETMASCNDCVMTSDHTQSLTNFYLGVAYNFFKPGQWL